MAQVLESANKDASQRTLSDSINIMTGRMLSYDYFSSGHNGSVESEAMGAVAATHRKKIKGCILLPLAVLKFCLFCTSVMLHEDIADVFMIESDLRNTVDDMFGEVEDIDGLWDLIQGDFVDTFFVQEDSYGSTLSKGNGDSDKWGMWGRVFTYNQMQGAVRFEQTRPESKAYGTPYTCGSTITCMLCRSNRGLQPFSVSDSQGGDCGNWQRRLGNETDEHSSEARQLGMISPALEAIVPDKPRSNDKELFRFYLYPGEEASDISERLQYFRDRQWLDGSSQSFAIRFYLLNADLGQPNMEQLTLYFYFHDGGSIYYQRDVQSIFVHVWPNAMCMLSDGFWFVLLLIATVVQVIWLWRAFRSRKFLACLTDLFWYIEMATVLGGWWCVIQFLQVFMIKQDIQDTMESVRSLGWNINDSNEGVVENMFKVGDDAADKALALRGSFAIYSIIIMFRFYANFHVQPRLSIVGRTMASLIMDIVHFLVLFIPAFLVYVASGVLLFGRRMQDFTTMMASLGSTFRMAQEGEYDWEGFKVEYYWSSTLWIWSFILFINLLMMNLLIAIILDAFDEISKSEKSQEAIWDTVNQFLHRAIYLRSWLNEDKVVALCKDPEHPDVLEKESLKEKFPNMPDWQLDLLMNDAAFLMKLRSEEDTRNPEQLLKMAGAMIASAGTAIADFGTINEEESTDPLQSWVVPRKKENGAADPGEEPPAQQNFIENPVETKGSKPPRFSKEDVVHFDTGNLEWSPEWLREVDGMMKAQRKWIACATWQLDSLLWCMQNANSGKLREAKAEGSGAGLSLM
eukprot:gb/GFBE01009216.1/.p1 GENE.gb/GFBE01009216.1/~~gb/GFBE01009216.1/.p1  ORF type:complete len:800 (+),score=199.38 gb/GFBE01009216.1/:1-2400(+)